MQKRIFNSISFCLFSITLSVAKIILSWAIISYDTAQCNPPIDTYFVCMIVHDAINGMVVLMRLVTIVSVYGGRQLDSEDLEAAYYNPGVRGAQVPRSILSISNLNNSRLTRFKWRIRITAALFAATNL